MRSQNLLNMSSIQLQRLIIYLTLLIHWGNIKSAARKLQSLFAAQYLLMFVYVFLVYHYTNFSLYSLRRWLLLFLMFWNHIILRIDAYVHFFMTIFCTVKVSSTHSFVLFPWLLLISIRKNNLSNIIFHHHLSLVRKKLVKIS